MLTIALAVLAITSDNQTPRPSDSVILAEVAAWAPGAVILEHTDRPMPAGLTGAKGICGVAMIDGSAQPFMAYAVWMPKHSIDSQRGTDTGRWSTTIRAPRSSEATVENNGERKAALSACPHLIAPTGVAWPTEVVVPEGVAVRGSDRLGADGRLIPSS